MQMHPRVGGQPVGDRGGLMRAEIIGNEMDLAAGRLCRDEVVQNRRNSALVCRFAVMPSM